MDHFGTGLTILVDACNSLAIHSDPTDRNRLPSNEEANDFEQARTAPDNCPRRPRYGRRRRCKADPLYLGPGSRKNALASVFCPREAVKIISTLHASIATFWRLTFSRRTCHSSNPTPPTLPIFLLQQDVIYVGGGNTKSMLALWREWGVDRILRQAWQQGTVLSGVSAGAICWFEQGLTDSIPGKLTPLGCLGFLPGSCSPPLRRRDRTAAKLPTLGRGW